MVFSSIPFIFYFLPLFLIIYYFVPFKFKNIILLIFSLIFYAWGEPIYILLMILSSFIDYMNGRLYVKNPNQKRYLFIAITINLLLLGFFKYSDLLIITINNIFKTNISLLNISLPIGISFYTFQTMSYSIDVYKNKVSPTDNFLNYLTYVSMFPQLVAGPIVRYEDISFSLEKRKSTFSNFAIGINRFLKGLFKKVLIANQIGFLFNILTNTSILSLWLKAISFTIQIYFDFSGYSDMAIGIGKMIGFDFPDNFNFPYISKSITEFWKRWHISLSSWFKDYVYIPLGGNRKGNIRTIINLLIVWTLTGLWHGASYNFILWGLYYGIILILEKFLLKNKINKLPNIIKHIYTLFFVIIGWVIFSCEDINILFFNLKGMFGFNKLPFINNEFIIYFKSYFVIIITGIILCIPYKFKNNKLSKIIKLFIYVVLFIITISYLISDSYNPFLYFRF